MYKQIRRSTIVVCISIVLFCGAESFTQQGYLMSITNAVKVDNRTIEFDVNIKSASSNFILTSYQFGFSFSQLIINNGNLTFSFIPGTSEFTSIPPATAIGLVNDYGIYVLTCASLPGEETITIAQKKVGRFRLRNSNNFAGTGFNVWWSFNGNGRTILTGNFFNDITNRLNHLNLVATTTFPLSVTINNGWNLVSVPGLHPTDQHVNTWWQYRNQQSSVYKFTNSYVSVLFTSPGEGYWLMNNGTITYNTGEEWPAGGIQMVANDPIFGNAGWNLIGGYDNYAFTSGITTTPAGLQSGFIYGFEPSTGYYVANNLTPGLGYLIYLNSSGLLHLPSTIDNVSPKTYEYVKKNWGKLIITDNAGKSYTLYCVSENINLNDYILPPVFLDENFDVRFGSGRFVEDLRNGVQSVEMRGIDFPVTIRVENINLKIQDETGNRINSKLLKGEEIIIGNNPGNKLFVSLDILPDNFSIKQNYPNPFNPSTTIEFSIPVEGNVRIKVYDMLGQEIKTLFNESVSAGNYFTNWDGKDNSGSLVTSGCYIYRIESGEFVQAMKMILMK